MAFCGGSHRVRAILEVILFLTSFLIWTGRDGWALSNDDCFACHANREILSLSREDLASQVIPVAPETRIGPKHKKRFGELSLFLNPNAYRTSIHGELECIACHRDVEDIPHRSKLQAVDCASCHEDIKEEAATSQDIHAKALAQGDPDAPLCQDCHGVHDIKSRANTTSRVHPRNQAHTCSRCHGDQELVSRHEIIIRTPMRAYKKSVHAQAIGAGNDQAATCSSCHTGHKISPASNPKSAIARINEYSTCGQCHVEESAQFEASVHGMAVKRGNLDAPSCSGCHNEHDIQSPKKPESPTFVAVIAKTTCPRCHGAEKINRKYGLPTDKVQTYEDSFHGLADRFGDTTAANCASCHGIHDIKPSADPTSRIHPLNLQNTCGTCHPGANARFASTPVHASTDIHAPTLSGRVQYWVRLFYYILIPLILCFMLFHNVIDYIKRIRAHYTKWRAEGKYLRLTVNERIQHIVLMLSFTLLVISGFALALHWEIPFIGGEFNQKLRALVHRVAAAAFMAYVVYHILWLGFSERGKGWFRDMIPDLKDLRDLCATLLFNLGLTEAKPKLRRFSYVEKVEYWGLLWGSILMTITGLILWFEKEAAFFIPPWGFNVANLIHYYEAILATLAVIIWHCYNVLINPDIAPMAMHWLTGKVPDDVLKSAHHLEWERLQAQQNISGDPSSPPTTD